LLASTAPACSALFAKSEPLSVRYFALPERSRPVSAAPPTNAVPLRLGRVAGAAHLDVRMIFRKADNEVVYEDSSRWSDNPASYFSRALAQSLFEERRIPQAMSGRALTLEADLLAFEAVQGGNGELARVSVAVTLHDERTSRWVETITVERPLSANTPERIVAALSSALDECVDKITERVIAELGR
jgi:ABC-type uncharacterized transport system auxiliary subunit